MIRTCPSCDAKNRVPAEHLTDLGKCGRCKDPLPPVAHPIDADPAIFQEILAGAKVPVLVDFWAAWCGPCKQVAPHVKRTAEEMAGEALVLKVDTERWPELARTYHVQGIPNFVVLRNGRVVFQQAGAVDSEEQQRWLREAAE